MAYSNEKIQQATPFFISRLAIQTLFQHSRLAPIHVWNPHFSSSNTFLMQENKSSLIFFLIKYSEVFFQISSVILHTKVCVCVCVCVYTNDGLF